MLDRVTNYYRREEAIISEDEGLGDLRGTSLLSESLDRVLFVIIAE
jgi:hypothetical protein